MSYLAKVISLKNNAVDKSDNQTLLTNLVTKIQTAFPTSKSVSITSTSSDESQVITIIRDYVQYIRSLKSFVDEPYDSDQIDITISQLLYLIPTAPSRNALINSLKKINSNKKVTFTTYGATMTSLKNIYGDALDTNTADDVIRDFIKSNVG